MGNPFGFDPGCLLKLGSYHPTEAGKGGPVFRCWLEQRMQFLWQPRVLSGGCFEGH